MPDTTRPYIKKTSPISNATEVDITSYISIEFSERMKDDSVNETNIGLFKDPLVAVDITLEYDDNLNVLIMKPDDTLDIDTRYSVVVSGTVQDYASNRMVSDYWWNFWTGEPSGYIYASGDQEQPEQVLLDGYIEVISTTPNNYTTNCNTDSLNQIVLVMSDLSAIGNRNFLGGSEPYSAAFGNAFFEDVNQSISGYILIDNQEVLGDTVIDHTPPTVGIVLSGNLILLNTSEMLDNNEYVVTLKAGYPGLNTNPLQEDYKFVFTSSYSPLYIGYNLIRLNIGPILQITMNYVPNDTLNRIIYSVSRQANNISLYVIDPSNIPWYVTEYVLYQSMINGLYAAIMMFASSGAGARKTLGDLTIDIDASKLMPALLPILDDYRKLRDKYQIMVESGSGDPAGPEWVIRAELDPRRPITDSSWRRLPFNDLRSTNAIAEGDSVQNRWIYTDQLNDMRYLTSERYLSEGRYVTSW